MYPSLGQSAQANGAECSSNRLLESKWIGNCTHRKLWTPTVRLNKNSQTSGHSFDQRQHTNKNIDQYSNNNNIAKISLSFGFFCHCAGQFDGSDDLASLGYHFRLYVVFELVEWVPLQTDRLALHVIELVCVGEIVRKVSHEVIG